MRAEVILKSRPSNLGSVVLDPDCEFLRAETGLCFMALFSKGGANSPSLRTLGPVRLLHLSDCGGLAMFVSG